MAVAFDASSESGTFTSTDPMTWTHTPLGTPRGVTVIFTSIQETPTISAVTYGGQALTLVRRVDQTGGEPGWTAIYFLGTGIPTGAQTVSIDHNGDGVQKRAACVTVTAAADTEIGADGGNQATSGNPQVALTTTPVSLRVVGLYATNDATNAYTALAGQTTIFNFSSGFRGLRVERQTTPSSGASTIGFTTTGAGDDDYAVVGAAIQEGAPPTSGTITGVQDPNVAAFTGTVTGPVPPVTPGVNRMGGTGAIRKPPRSTNPSGN